MVISRRASSTIYPSQVGQPKTLHVHGNTQTRTYFVLDDVNSLNPELRAHMRAERQLTSTRTAPQRECAFVLYKLFEQYQSILSMTFEDAQAIFVQLKAFTDSSARVGSASLFERITRTLDHSALPEHVAEQFEFALSSCQRKGLFEDKMIPLLGRNGQTVKAGPSF